jgi:hypothetical protein
VRIRESLQNTLLMQGSLRKYFHRIHFIMFSYPYTQNLLQPWFKVAWLLLKMAADVGIIPVMLVFQIRKMQEL